MVVENRLGLGIFMVEPPRGLGGKQEIVVNEGHGQTLIEAQCRTPGEPGCAPAGGPARIGPNVAGPLESSASNRGNVARQIFVRGRPADTLSASRIFNRAKERCGGFDPPKTPGWVETVVGVSRKSWWGYLRGDSKGRTQIRGSTVSPVASKFVVTPPLQQSSRQIPCALESVRPIRAFAGRVHQIGTAVSTLCSRKKRDWKTFRPPRAFRYSGL